MLLPHHFGEVPGPVFAGEHDVRHRRDSKESLRAARRLRLTYNPP
jgi:hypothetical protein